MRRLAAALVLAVAVALRLWGRGGAGEGGERLRGFARDQRPGARDILIVLE